MSFNHSSSNCIKSLLIICSKSAKVTSKQCSKQFSKLFIRFKERSVTSQFVITVALCNKLLPHFAIPDGLCHKP